MITYPISSTILPSFLWLVVYGFFILMMYLPSLPVNAPASISRDLIFAFIPFFMWLVMTPFGKVGSKLDIIAINPAIIFLASVLTAGVSFAVGQNAKVRKAREDPIADKATSAVSYTGIALAWVVFVIILSRFMDLYRA
jgi:hypothetical protein